MYKLVSATFCTFITSCFLFPFILISIPFANSKMILAAIGLVILGIQLTKHKEAQINKDFFTLSLWALAVSFIAWFASVYNNTKDLTYSSYIMSMWVWLGGAYCTVSAIKYVHGYISLELMSKYMIAVCVVQCFLALLFDFNGAASNWYNHTFGGEEGYMGALNDKSRLHGIGCALDVAGFRFAAIAAIALYLIATKRFSDKTAMVIFISVAFIFIVGDMISRSTFIGIVFGLLFWIFHTLAKKYSASGSSVFKYLLISMCVLVPIITYFYYNNHTFHNNLRFGFEGFFSYFETGEWESHSNTILKNMVVWPEHLRTWIIGDGYIVNPSNPLSEGFDPYYLGPDTGGYYMGTDIGYLRFIFYFGLIGLLTFMGFFVKTCHILVCRFPGYSFFFILILLINFTEWFKVATDLFVIFCPFLCISHDDQNNYLESVSNDVNSSSAA